MPAESHIKIGNNWVKLGSTGVYANVGGTWQPVNNIYDKVSGTWQTVYVRDTTGPASPSGVTARWEGSGLRINWTNPPDADYDSMRIVIRPGVEPTLAPITVYGATNTIHYTTYIKDYLVYTATLTPYDVHGNAGTSVTVTSMGFTGAARGRTPTSFFIKPIDSGTWRTSTGGWRVDMPGSGYGQWVIQGASAEGENFGTYFYGTQFWDYLRGATITSASLELQRTNSAGLGGAVEPEFYWSQDCTSKASNPSASSMNDYIYHTPGLSRNGDTPNYAYVPLTAGYRTAMGANSLGSSLRSIIFNAFDVSLISFIGDVSYSYMKMTGAYEGPYTITPGRINVAHSG